MNLLDVLVLVIVGVLVLVVDVDTVVVVAIEVLERVFVVDVVLLLIVDAK